MRFLQPFASDCIHYKPRGYRNRNWAVNGSNISLETVILFTEYVTMMAKSMK
jgi:hypothetical protein